jgi:hypothetical protein
MDFSQKRREQMKIRSIADLKRSGRVTGKMNSALFVNGPAEFDCLENKWSRQEVLGLVGDSSSGKSEVVLYCFKEMLRNNPNGCAIYVSLEMTDEKLAQRWFEMTKDCPEISERMFIISRYDDEGKSRDVSIHWIKKEVVKYKEVIGDVVAFCIDHIHCLGENDPSTLNSIMIILKEMAVELNSFTIALAQVNKGAGQKGEVPLDADSVLGCSQLKYICSDIIQIHRPILRLEEEAKMSVLGYGYCKIREAKPSDKMKKGQNKLLKYLPEERSFKKLSTEEMSVFKLYYNELLAMKSAEERNKSYSYDLTKEVRSPDGRIITISEKFSGSVEEDY